MYSKYYGQVDDDTRGTLKEDANFERAYNAKEVIALQKMLKAINYNYKKSKEEIKTMYQATKDFILMKQHKKDIQKYYENFKTLNNVVQEVNKSNHGSPFVDIICRERGNNPTALTPDKELKCIKKGRKECSRCNC